MVHIITDTTACLPSGVAERYQIPVIPQIINFGSDSYKEGSEMGIQEFMKRLRASKELPKTAAPPPELFAEEFQRLVPTREPIVCIHPSAVVSGTVRSATVAAMDFPGADIRIIDTRLIASPLGTIVEQAAQWAQAGLEADTIVARIEDMMRRCRIYFMVDTLEYLARGGRIGGASALVGSVLQIKPILTLVDGRVEPYERERTHRRAVARLKEIVHEQIPGGGTGFLTVMHADVLEEASRLAAELGAEVNQHHVPISDLPPAIITHGGPGILGAGFFTR